MTIAGFLGGVIAPSRDMLVRNAAPAGAAGRAFGIVSTGFNFSADREPAAVRLDHGPEHAAWVFIVSALFMALTVVLTFFTERKTLAQVRRPPTSAEADALLSRPTQPLTALSRWHAAICHQFGADAG